MAALGTGIFVSCHFNTPHTLPAGSNAGLCKDYVSGFCRNGEKCVKSHALVRVEEEERYCELYTRGECPIQVRQCNGGVHPCKAWESCGYCPTPACPYVHNPTYVRNRARLPFVLKDRIITNRFTSELPGVLSPDGPAHDNDHVDISDIKILPTIDEILSSRPVYMPSKNLSAVHFLPAGAARLTDILFRQLRYDSIEHVIDICYRSCQLLVSAKVNSTLNQFQTSHETPQGVRFSVFHDIKFEELLFDDTRGLLARVSFFCPVHLRSTKVADALGTLEKGMLAALVGLGSNNNQLSTTFFEVHLRESTESMNPRGGNGMRAGAQLSFANPHCEEDVRRIVSYAKSEYHGTFLLVEFPKTLLAGFSHCLKQLQQQINLNTLPFSDYITSPGFSLQPKVIKPPAYSLVENFSFNLNCLKLQDSKNPDDLKLPVYEPDQRISYINLVKNETTLDEGQAEALCDNLTRELAFCQGPPGTGKSFLGSALVRTILASQEPEDKRPIIAVCMTNHALDSFLKDLIDHGVGDVVRLGRNSKENWISKYLLSNSRKSVDRSRKEQFEQTLCHINQQALASAGLKFCEAIGTSNLTWLVVKDHLKSNYPNIYDQFVAMDITESHGHQYRAASQIGGFGYRCWASGSDLDSLNQLSDELYSFLGVDPDSNDVYSPTLNAIQKMLATIQMSARDSMELVGLGNSIWAMSLLERNSLISQWLREINLSIVVEQMTILHLRHQRSVQKKIEMYKDSDKRVLLSKQVIGMTTTACAKNWSLLERVKPHVVICEEAGEVMEAQTLCTLFPSIQHAIFIGDPLQLRPQISQQALSLETEAGQSYRLDESLFERLMYPKYTDCVPIPTSHLTIQRRMHPEIADISRSTLYPYLKDHESTHMHFPVAGMVNRVYWFDHTSPEDQSDTTSAFSKSFSNTFEAEMVSNMVKYLMEQNVYDLGDIAVLVCYSHTPYNCQLALLTKCLRSFFTIFLTDKDREALIDSGLLSQEELSMSGQRSKINLCDMLKVATIDNFQGEEAKVVIISTVRSNQRGSVGFLKTQNRINVACSRARDGFYIIGNAALMAKTNMWSTIVNLLKSKNKLGPYFTTCCSRHRALSNQVWVGSDFKAIKPCQVVCGLKLDCSHACRELCHDPSLHDRIKCFQPCERRHDQCGHKCQGACGDKCRPCRVPINDVMLKCKHVRSIECSEAIQFLASDPECSEMTEMVLPECGHTIKTTCSSTEKANCTEKCISLLSCGHICPGNCSSCGKDFSNHQACTSLCGRLLYCGHRCTSICHEGNCGPCKEICTQSCTHGTCENICSSPCDPCLEPCGLGCEHSGKCQRVCCMPCNILPCNKRCTLVLQCGHECSGLCGEKCHESCGQCSNVENPDKPQIYLECSHSFAVDTLDSYVEFHRFYRNNDEGLLEKVNVPNTTDYTLPGCPSCGGSLRTVKRYSYIFRISQVMLVVDRLLEKLCRQTSLFVEELTSKKQSLALSFGLFQSQINPTPLAAASNKASIRERGNSFAPIEAKIKSLKDGMAALIEREISQLAGVAFAQDAVPYFHFRLMLNSLEFKCRQLTFKEGVKMADFLATLNDPSQHLQALAKGLEKLVGEQSVKIITQMASLIRNCEENHLPRLEVELTLLQAEIYRLSLTAETQSNLNTDECFERVAELCLRFPETAGKFQLDQTTVRKYAQKIGPTTTLYGNHVFEFWESLGKHATGQLVICENSHFFCGLTFDGCPECGKEDFFIAKAKEGSVSTGLW